MMNENVNVKPHTFVLHTSGFIRNPMVHRVILINNKITDINHLLSRYMDGNKDKENIVKQVHVHGEIGDCLDIREDFQGVVKVFESIRHSSNRFIISVGQGSRENIDLLPGRLVVNGIQESPPRNTNV